MKVKKFTGKNIQEIYQQIKLEMGKDAVILHTKKQKKGGFFGFFTKEFYEVTAAVEEFNYDDEESLEAKRKEETKENEAIKIINQQISIPQVKPEENSVHPEQETGTSLSKSYTLFSVLFSKYFFSIFFMILEAILASTS